MVRGMGKARPPSGQSVWDQVTTADRRRISNWNRGGRDVIDRTTYGAATALGPVESPFKAIPLASETAQFGPKTTAYEMISFFGDDLDDMDSAAMEYYAWDEEGYEFNNNAADPRGWRPEDANGNYDPTPAPITIVPTSTINPDRPRTVAAGYDSKQDKLTVIFRDGTYYNYYEVSSSTWKGFKAARSKGRFIAANLDTGHPRGPADVLSIPVFARETVYRFLRTGQSFRNGIQPGAKPAKKAVSTSKPAISRTRGQFGPSGVTMPKRP